MMKVTKTMAPNQYVLTTSNGMIEVFQSYDSLIAQVDKMTGKVQLSKHYDYSRTTMRYLKQFLGHGVAETRKKIESGEYTLTLEV